MTRERIQHKRLTFDIITKASEPLKIDDEALEKLRAALENSARLNIDMRYNPDGDRYMESYHNFVGVDGPDEEVR